MERMLVISGHTHGPYEYCADCSYVAHMLNPPKMVDNESNPFRIVAREKIANEMSQVYVLAHRIICSRIEGQILHFDLPLDSVTILKARDQFIENKRVKREQKRALARNYNVINFICLTVVSLIACLYYTNRSLTP